MAVATKAAAGGGVLALASLHQTPTPTPVPAPVHSFLFEALTVRIVPLTICLTRSLPTVTDEIINRIIVYVHTRARGDQATLSLLYPRSS